MKTDASGHGSGSVRWLPFLSLAACLVCACASRVLEEVEADRRTDDDSAGAETGGEGLAGLYGACESADLCSIGFEFCIFPSGEHGFCTKRCADPAVDCAAQGAGAAQSACVRVGSDGVSVCALDCEGGRTCPAGMSCRQVQVTDGRRSLCF